MTVEEIIGRYFDGDGNCITNGNGILLRMPSEPSFDLVWNDCDTARLYHTYHVFMISGGSVSSWDIFKAKEEEK